MGIALVSSRNTWLNGDRCFQFAIIVNFSRLHWLCSNRWHTQGKMYKLWLQFMISLVFYIVGIVFY